MINTMVVGNVVNGVGAFLTDSTNDPSNQKIGNQNNGVADLSVNLATNIINSAYSIAAQGNVTASGLIGSILSQIVGPAGTLREGQYFTGTSAAANKRWTVGVTGEAEGGSNAGSNFYIRPFSDTGTGLGTAISINRANSGIVLGNQLYFNGAALPPNAVNDAAAAGAGVGIGQVYRNGSVLMVRVA
jgi:hypothetical protein